jgi:tetratricopeptide (TPR) repeat protein
MTELYNRVVRSQSFLIGAALAVITLAVFIRARTFDFVNIDDPQYVTGNAEVLQGLGLHGLVWAATTGSFANWHPLTWLSLQLDVQLFGPGPAGFHTTNVLLHAASTAILFWALERLTGARWRSACVAALFALHPLHVESVAWVAERKDALSGLFWMLTLYAYARYAEQGRRAWYVAALAAFALGLMAKPMLVTLPCVLLLLDYWPLGRLGLSGKQTLARRAGKGFPRWRVGLLSAVRQPAILEKLPFFALSAALSAVTVVVQRQGGAMDWMSYLSWPTRVANALVSYVTYLGKTLWPSHLAVFYTYALSPNELWWRAVAAFFLLAAVTALTIAWRRSHPYLLVGWLWYLGTLVPVIGLVQVGSQALADRYTYIPLIGLFLAGVWGIAELAARWQLPARVPVVAALGALTACVVLTLRQLDCWQGSLALWEHAVEATPDNYVAHYNLGVVLHNQGKLNEARRHYAESIRINPTNPRVKNKLGLTLLYQGRPAQALPNFAEAAREQPDLADAHFNLGVAQKALGDMAGAEKSLVTAAQLEPESAEAFAQLGAVLSLEGKMEAAAAAYRRAIALEPGVAKLYFDLAYALAEQGRTPEARECYGQALRLDATLAAYAERGAWMLATSPDAQLRRGSQALRLARQACQATAYRRPDFLDTLAAAYAETGRFDEAQTAARQALDLLKGGPAERIDAVTARLELYRKHQPYRDEAGRGHWAGLESSLTPRGGR